MGRPNGRLAIVVLGQETVVLGAQQADVFRTVIATQRERVPVVELEPRPLGTAPVVHVHVAAARAVALAYGTAHRGRDVAGSSGSIDLGERCPRGFRAAETASFQPVQLLADSPFDDGR